MFGAIHFLIVGVPFIQAGGGGEGLLYILIIDFPLYLMANVVTPRLLLNSVTFNFWLFAVGGTIMYAALAYLIARALVRGR